jgi:hypothetical protein
MNKQVIYPQIFYTILIFKRKGYREGRGKSCVIHRGITFNHWQRE